MAAADAGPTRPRRPPAGMAALHAATVLIDGVCWRVCPVRGPCCFRVTEALGDWASDAITVHVRVAHLGWSHTR